MSKTAEIVRNKSSVVIYQDRTVTGRRQFIVRTAQGHRLYECRKVRALISFLRNNRHTPYVYDELPYRVQKQLDNSRAATRHEVAKQQGRLRVYRPTLGNLFPQLHQLKVH